jgi:hypothetical protein
MRGFEHAAQAHLGRRLDTDGNDLAQQAVRAHGVHGLQIGTAADDLTGVATFFLEQHRHDLADLQGVERLLLLVEQGVQAIQALGLDRFVHLAGHGRGRGAGAARIFEREGGGETDLADQVQGLLEIAVALAGEADDEVAAHGDVGPAARIFSISRT